MFCYETSIMSVDATTSKRQRYIIRCAPSRCLCLLIIGHPRLWQAHHRLIRPMCMSPISSGILGIFPLDPMFYSQSFLLDILRAVENTLNLNLQCNNVTFSCISHCISTEVNIQIKGADWHSANFSLTPSVGVCFLLLSSRFHLFHQALVLWSFSNVASHRNIPGALIGVFTCGWLLCSHTSIDCNSQEMSDFLFFYNVRF